MQDIPMEFLKNVVRECRMPGQPLMEEKEIERTSDSLVFDWQDYPKGNKNCFNFESENSLIFIYFFVGFLKCSQGGLIKKAYSDFVKCGIGIGSYVLNYVLD